MLIRYSKVLLLGFLSSFILLIPSCKNYFIESTKHDAFFKSCDDVKEVHLLKMNRYDTVPEVHILISDLKNQFVNDLKIEGLWYNDNDIEMPQKEYDYYAFKLKCYDGELFFFEYYIFALFDGAIKLNEKIYPTSHDISSCFYSKYLNNISKNTK